MKPLETSEPPVEAQLIRQVRGGNANAFSDLVERHLDHLRGFIALKLPIPHLVDEIAHEAFVFAFRNIDQFDPDTGFRAWLRAIAGNLVRAELQRYRREQNNQLNYARYQRVEADASAKYEDPARISFLNDCVQELPEGMQELLFLKYTRELRVEQIAAQLRRTQTSVWQTLFRVRQQLKMCVEGKMNNSRGAIV